MEINLRDYKNAIEYVRHAFIVDLLQKNVQVNDLNELRNTINNYLTVYQHKLSDPINEKMDTILQYELSGKKLTDCNRLPKVNGYNVSLWQGDITTLSCDVIVNAANKDGLGCFTVGHKCIDNIIHSKAGPRMRAECKTILGDKKIETGELISTLGYNLPARYVFHTVGPIGNGNIELIKCYLNCLKRAKNMKLHSIAFCCISTGEYGFSQSKACFLALNSVKRWIKDNNYNIHVIFCVFKDDDYALYSENIKKTFNLESGAKEFEG